MHTRHISLNEPNKTFVNMIYFDYLSTLLLIITLILSSGFFWGLSPGENLSVRVFWTKLCPLVRLWKARSIKYTGKCPPGDAQFFPSGDVPNRDCYLFLYSNMQFTTKDADNDGSSDNCAVRHKGGWWYNSCSQANPNGIYYSGKYSNQNADGVKWFTLRGHITHSNVLRWK